MGLSLVVGPANAGKVALLLDRYSALAERDPVLVVPNRAEAERIELELLERTPTLFGGSIGTFDDLFDSIAFAGGEMKPAIPSAQRRLLVAQVVSSASLNGLSASARFPGFADALGKAVEDASEGLLDPADLEDRSARSTRAISPSSMRLGRWDRPARRRYAAERVANELDAWDGRPVFLYGFEDFTGAEWMLVEALPGRGDVTVSLPYEPGRPAFASLARTSYGPQPARERKDRRAAARPLGPGAGARAPRAGALRRIRRGRPAARRRGALPRGGRLARRARARRRGDPRPASPRNVRRPRSRSSARASSATGRRSRPSSARSGSRMRSKAA